MQSLEQFQMGREVVHLVLRPPFGLLDQPRMIDEYDCGAIGGMRIGKGNRSTRREPAPMSLYPPQIPHEQTRAAAMSYGTALILQQ
jgi:hypothetical protein